jgi:phosphinothricin tripeptide acetyl hydrolase
MPSAEITAVRKMLAEMSSNEPVSIADQRRNMDNISQLFPLTADYVVEPGKVGGIEGDWVRKRGVRSDAALLYLHGGGYSLGSPLSHRHLVGAISAAANIPVFAANYRMAPENQFPAAVDDATAAYKGLLNLGYPAGRLAISGDSAGGGLTVATLVSAKQRGLAMPAAAALISPWADLSNSSPSYRARAERDPMIQRQSLDNFAAAYLGKQDVKTPLASPLFADLKGLPPLLIQVGADEVLHDDSVLLHERASEAGVESTLESWGEMIHVWHFFHPMLARGREAIERIGQFLRSRMG